MTGTAPGYQRRVLYGVAAEAVLADAIKARGGYVYRYRRHADDPIGRGPALEGATARARFPLPDLLVRLRDRGRLWHVEVKARSAPAYQHSRGRHVHGIDARSWWQACELATGARVAIAIVEHEAGVVRWADLRRVRAYACQCPPCRDGRPCTTRRVFVDVADVPVRWNLTAAELARINDARRKAEDQGAIQHGA